MHVKLLSIKVILAQLGHIKSSQADNKNVSNGTTTTALLSNKDRWTHAHHVNCHVKTCLHLEPNKCHKNFICRPYTVKHDCFASRSKWWHTECNTCQCHHPSQCYKWHQHNSLAALDSIDWWMLYSWSTLTPLCESSSYNLLPVHEFTVHDSFNISATLLWMQIRFFPRTIGNSNTMLFDPSPRHCGPQTIKYKFLDLSLHI